jgi:hypothetical protein
MESLADFSQKCTPLMKQAIDPSKCLTSTTLTSRFNAPFDRSLCCLLFLSPCIVCLRAASLTNKEKYTSICTQNSLCRYNYTTVCCFLNQQLQFHIHLHTKHTNWVHVHDRATNTNAHKHTHITPSQNTLTKIHSLGTRTRLWVTRAMGPPFPSWSTPLSRRASHSTTRSSHSTTRASHSIGSETTASHSYTSTLVTHTLMTNTLMTNTTLC